MQNEDVFYVQETGAILSPNRTSLYIVEGSPGSVDFPPEVIWNLHKAQPGIVFCLSHVHPPEMTGLSGRDEMTLRTWAYSLAPFPARIATIAQTGRAPYGISFKETVYLGVLESKEEWIARGKEGPRKFEIIIESENTFLDHPHARDYSHDSYTEILIDKSYK